MSLISAADVLIEDKKPLRVGIIFNFVDYPLVGIIRLCYIALTDAKAWPVPA